MTRREAAIVSAYTATLLGTFNAMHEYVEEILGRPVFTHEMASAELWEQIKVAARADFTSIDVTVEVPS